MLNGPDKQCQFRARNDCISIVDMQMHSHIENNREIYEAVPDVKLSLKLNTLLLTEEETFGPKSHIAFMNVENGVNIVGTFNDIT
jgi:predicted nucleic acid-binding protein